MHDTASYAGSKFAEAYGKENFTVVDIGGLNVNGSLREFFESKGMKYICVDIEKHPSVDVVIQPGGKLPFDTGSIDLIVSTSCFEHDPCFWMTFKEMGRILKMGGHVYVNAPTNGYYHAHPGDNWRFYSDAGQALAYWSGIQMGTEEIHPLSLVEVFHIMPIRDIWKDYVCVWKRVEETTKEITTPPQLIKTSGPLEKLLHDMGLSTIKKC
jgi:SAM-dependent methyltransferase